MLTAGFDHNTGIASIKSNVKEEGNLTSFLSQKKESRIQVMPYIIKQGGREANTHHKNNRIRTAPSCLFQYRLIFGEVYRD